uniref:Neuromedin U n=1 Tax=Oryctolagus cuniculus TaxID=9986 RepID=A0A5F9DR94_RABIT
MPRAARQRPGPAPLSLLLPLLLACCADSGRGAPVLSYGLYPEQELQLWNKAPDTLRELCLMLMGIPPRPQEQDEKDNTKRFLFHYSKTQKLGNSNVVSSVLHPLLQLLPHLHERRMKRFPVDEEFQSPFGSRSRGYFLFRPRNGRRSIGLI